MSKFTIHFRSHFSFFSLIFFLSFFFFLPSSFNDIPIIITRPLCVVMKLNVENIGFKRKNKSSYKRDATGGLHEDLKASQRC